MMILMRIWDVPGREVHQCFEWEKAFPMEVGRDDGGGGGESHCLRLPGTMIDVHYFMESGGMSS
jgi:hypothetical protein